MTFGKLLLIMPIKNKSNDSGINFLMLSALTIQADKAVSLITECAACKTLHVKT